MRKVYFYLPEYPETPTGGIKYHKIVYEYFKKQTDDAYILGDDYFSKFADRNKFWKVVTGLLHAFKAKRRSVIILSNTSFLHFMIPMLINKFYKKHVYFLIVHHLVRNEKPEYFRIKFEEYYVRNADHVITVSSTTRNEMLKHGLIKSDDIKIVPPGLDKISIRRDTNADDGKKNRILFIGTLEERKGVIHLIEALKYLKGSDIELDIIGNNSTSDKYYEHLKQKVKDYELGDKIFFRGRVSSDELEQYYRNASIFVFPSLWEGYGMVIAEAMSHSLPVIAFKIPALEEIVNDGINGYLVEAGNSKLFSEKISELLNDKGLLKKFSESAKSRSGSFQTWEKTGSDIYEIINRI